MFVIICLNTFTVSMLFSCHWREAIQHACFLLCVYARRTKVSIVRFAVKLYQFVFESVELNFSLI